MRFTMGRYIRELDTEGRDRLIAAHDYSDGMWWDGSCGCLCATAEPAIGHAGSLGLNYTWPEKLTIRASVLCGPLGGPLGPALRYPRAVRRFGKARVVRAIKARAARENGCSPEQIEAMLRETVPA